MKKILLGNDAIIKGALASGVSFVSGYPGCPSAEIGDNFGKIAKENGVYAEWSTNEKTALEASIGASFSGLKSLVNMKSFGINVCADSLLPLAYTGTKAGMVIVVADDPSCWSSAQTEQNSRAYSVFGHFPTLEPADPQECYDFTKLAFEISEKFNTPVILHTTTRVNHQKMPVDFSVAERNNNFVKGEFIKNPHQFSTMPPRTLEMKAELLAKIEKIKQFVEKSKVNFVIGKEPLDSAQGRSKIGIITSGVSYLYTQEAMENLGLDLPILKLGFFYPLPEKKISDFIKDKKKILVIEELDPYLEKEIKILAKEVNLKVEVFGKNANPEAGRRVLSEIGELNSEKICIAIAEVTGKKFKEFKIENWTLRGASAIKFKIPSRTARLCESCPYWYVFPVLKRIAPDAIFGGDIGCNMIANLAPHNLSDYMFAMGAGIGISHGVKKSTNQKVISIMGDGTFFHSGIAGLINAVYNKSNPLVVILDNRITAMTGHQSNPGMGRTLMGDTTEELSIEEIAKACGVKNIKVLDPINMQELENTVKDLLTKDEISLIICKRVCALLAKRQNAQQHDQ